MSISEPSDRQSVEASERRAHQTEGMRRRKEHQRTPTAGEATIS